MYVDRAYSAVNEFSELSNTRLCDLGWSTGAVGSDSAVVAGEIRALEITQAAGTVAGAGSPNRDETQPLYGTGDKLAVEAAAYEDSDAIVAETPGTGEKTTMPEGIDRWRWRVVTGKGSRIADVTVTKGHTEAADGNARQAGDDGEGDALLQGESLGHEDEFTVGSDR